MDTNRRLGCAWQAKLELTNQTLWQASLPIRLLLNRSIAPRVSLYLRPLQATRPALPDGLFQHS
jgi:hypothetical protein